MDVLDRSPRLDLFPFAPPVTESPFDPAVTPVTKVDFAQVLALMPAAMETIPVEPPRPATVSAEPATPLSADPTSTLEALLQQLEQGWSAVPESAPSIPPVPRETAPPLEVPVAPAATFHHVIPVGLSQGLAIDPALRSAPTPKGPASVQTEIAPTTTVYTVSTRAVVAPRNPLATKPSSLPVESTATTPVADDEPVPLPEGPSFIMLTIPQPNLVMPSTTPTAPVSTPPPRAATTVRLPEALRTWSDVPSVAPTTADERPPVSPAAKALAATFHVPSAPRTPVSGERVVTSEPVDVPLDSPVNQTTPATLVRRVQPAIAASPQSAMDVPTATRPATTPRPDPLSDGFVKPAPATASVPVLILRNPASPPLREEPVSTEKARITPSVPVTPSPETPRPVEAPATPLNTATALPSIPMAGLSPVAPQATPTVIPVAEAATSTAPATPVVNTPVVHTPFIPMAVVSSSTEPVETPNSEASSVPAPATKSAKNSPEAAPTSPEPLAVPVDENVVLSEPAGRSEKFEPKTVRSQDDSPREFVAAPVSRSQPSITITPPALDFGDPVPMQESRQLVQRLGDAIGLSQESGQHLSIRVTPPQFGPIVVGVTMHEGVLSARVETHSAVAQQMLTDHLPQLHESLSARGAVIDRIEIVPVESRLPEPHARVEAVSKEAAGQGGWSSQTPGQPGSEPQETPRRRTPPPPVPPVSEPAAVEPAVSTRPIQLHELNVRV